MKKLTRYFYFGVILSGVIALAIPITLRSFDLETLTIAILVVAGQAHFIIAYLYYIDILRIRLPSPKKMLIFGGSFILLVVAYYFTRYVWLVALTPTISFFALIYFFTHHAENIFHFGEDFHQNLRPKRRSTLNFWLVTYTIALFTTFIIYAYYILESSSSFTIFNIWYLLVSFAILFFAVFKVYREISTKRVLLLSSILLVFTGPFFLKYITLKEMAIIIPLWHVIMWLILYPIRLHFRDKEGFPKRIGELPTSLVSKFLRKTRENVWNFIMFYIFVNAFMLFLYFYSANIQGLPALSSEMAYNGIFWGYSYFELWAFAHITFSFFPKTV